MMSKELKIEVLQQFIEQKGSCHSINCENVWSLCMICLWVPVLITKNRIG